MNLLDPLIAQPVVIIGAGRSGTNMLRNALTRLEGFETWPCDEINYIWRHGNRGYPTDEFGADLATPRVANFIRQRFNQLSDKSALHRFPESSRFVVEKTCANSLRVPFVDAVLPEAKYIHLIRDGRRVVSSALKRWKAPLDISYLAAKARYVPPTDLPYYAVRYFANRMTKLASKESALSVWGPRFEEMRDIAAEHPLEYMCAAQWKRCVGLSEAAFAQMSPEKVITVHYEDFVREPAKRLTQIGEFLNLEFSKQSYVDATADVINMPGSNPARFGAIAQSDESPAHDSANLGPDTIVLMQDMLSEYGYIEQRKAS